jgi:hypothetical protein
LAFLSGPILFFVAFLITVRNAKVSTNGN